MKIHRWLQCDYRIDSLHFFYAIKVCLNDTVNVHLVRTKPSVAPLKERNSYSKIKAFCCQMISECLSINVSQEFKTVKVVFWIDSTTVLSWLKREQP